MKGFLYYQLKSLKHTTTFLRKDLTPYQLYIKLLIEYFGPAIVDPNSETDIPSKYKRLSYQMDAVKQGFLLLQEHNGFLSDVVGLENCYRNSNSQKISYSQWFPKNTYPKL